MINKELQEQRMRGYFVQATKEILKGEGVKSLNVRSIAQHAGYSYATMYHYFRDVKELIFLCVEDFQKEIADYVVERAEKSPSGLKRIHSITKAYVGYFVEYPSIFNLFFIERLGDISSRLPVAEKVYNFLDTLCHDEWETLQTAEGADNNQIQKIRQELNFVTCGMLVFYMNRMQPSDYHQFTANVEVQLSHILNRIHQGDK